MNELSVREYGSGPHLVIVLHGGPAAAGDVAPLARELGNRWHVFEPFQRGSGGNPLTVATHVRDLHDLIQRRCPTAPVLIGHSWGAMLALAYAAAHSATAAALVLIGCGTFSVRARAEFQARLDGRLTPGDRAALADLNAEPNRDRRLVAEGQLKARVYGYDADEMSNEFETFDATAHSQTWEDMVRLQETGVYPVAFEAIEMPVLMMHGDVDPHPGAFTRDDLLPHIPHLQYRELGKCGHSPWLERRAKYDFYQYLNAWLEARFQSPLPLAG
jgi:pimeloyl-ACP methyl ester carboxylesterase